MNFENLVCNLLRGRFFCLCLLVVERGRDNNSATKRSLLFCNSSVSDYKCTKPDGGRHTEPSTSKTPIPIPLF